MNSQAQDHFRGGFSGHPKKLPSPKKSWCFCPKIPSLLSGQIAQCKDKAQKHPSCVRLRHPSGQERQKKHEIPRLEMTRIFHFNMFFLKMKWVFPKIMVPPNHPLKLNNRVFHYFHHPFWGPNPPIFWKHPHIFRENELRILTKNPPRS